MKQKLAQPLLPRSFIKILIIGGHVPDLKALKQAPRALGSTNSMGRAVCGLISLYFLTKFLASEKYSRNCADISLKRKGTTHQGATVSLDGRDKTGRL